MLRNVMSFSHYSRKRKDSRAARWATTKKG
jgi:hypothetical protein